jgi:hypothetical protein
MRLQTCSIRQHTLLMHRSSPQSPLAAALMRLETLVCARESESESERERQGERGREREKEREMRGRERESKSQRAKECARGGRDKEPEGGEDVLPGKRSHAAHTSAYVSIRQHTSAYFSIHQHT